MYLTNLDFSVISRQSHISFISFAENYHKICKLVSASG